MSGATDFKAVYNGLNDAQRVAVDTIYGPVLVIAGPGTGKTQLLSARVAHILQATDALAANILCLTFTENGAANMRERLTRFIGTDAYDVSIGTYHAFGSTIIRRFPEYFTETRLERPIDELGKHQLLAEILERTPYSSPIKQLRHHLGDLISTISEVKRGLLTPDDLRAIATENIDSIEQTKSAIATALAGHTTRLPSKLSASQPLFEAVLAALKTVPSPAESSYPSYAALAAAELEMALEDALATDKTKPLTTWKNHWLVKDTDDQYILGGTLEARRIAALADVLEHYQAGLAAQGLYDFDDMILRAIAVLEQHDDLRFTLQEQYQFILLDEFQDTNAAQLRLVQLLTDSPSNEGKPNVLAVGDDDQAIYAFQGAEASNMLDFFRLYRDVKVISLSENYRSRSEILIAAANVAAQIETRLHTHFENIEKTLVAKNSTLPTVTLQRASYTSAIAERTAVAAEIAHLIATGTPPTEIAILAPKHKYLEPLVPYLQANAVAVSYEKRENILDAPVVRQLLTMARLVLALHDGKHGLADSLWPEVLSYDFWDFSTADIWDISWRANDTRSAWGTLLLASPEFKHAALLILTLAGKVETETLEYMLDALIGTIDVQTHDRELPSVRSPLRTHYFESSGDTMLYETVSQLTVLRTKLREHQTGEGRMLALGDLMAFVAAYEAAGQQMLDTSPYDQSADAVQLMTVYKAKGLEFAHVFLVESDDSVWGTKAASMGNKLTLPANLAAIRHAGSTDDERLRLLFVAMTRAKHGLHLSSHAHTFSGKVTTPVKYLDETTTDEGDSISRVFPEQYQHVVQDASDPPSLEALTMNWQTRHLRPDVTLKTLLQKRLERYQLSPTHLTSIINLKYGGPESFVLGTLLRFPSAPSIDAIFGNAIHDTLQWVQDEQNATHTLPSITAAQEHASRFLAREPLTEAQLDTQQTHANDVLAQYLTHARNQFREGNIAEKSFRDEGVFVGPAHLGGKIDLLEIDHEHKTITVVDYKTGQLGADPAKLHRYSLQLYCYKLLVEGSHAFANYQVKQGRLVFVEPDQHGQFIEKRISFDDTETKRVAALLIGLWHAVTTLEFPATDPYGESLKDMLAYEDEFIALHDA